MVLGSSGSTPLTLSRTSCAATSVSFSSRNADDDVREPSDEIERSSSMPLMVLTASSILSVISVSICSGAAPGLDRRDDDGREVDLGEPVDAEARERERADDGQREDEHGREDRTADAERGEPLHEAP